MVALETLLSGSQSVTIDGMSFSKSRLSDLMEMRKQLKREAGHAFGYSMRPLKPPEH